MPIELHAFDTPNGRKISVALEEMALPYTVKVVDIRKRQQFEPDFLEISPSGKIPAIVDPDGPGGKPVSVFESGAILIYLGEKTGRFWPRDLRARIPVLEWLMFQMGNFGPIPGQVHHFATVENEDDRRYGLERYSKETRRLYAVMDGRLAKREYFADELVDRRLRHSGVGVAAPPAQGGSRRVSACPSLVRDDDGAPRRPPRLRGEAELIRGAVSQSRSVVDLHEQDRIRINGD